MAKGSPTTAGAAADVRARASARYVRMTPTKVRRVVDLIRGMEAREALSVLQFAPQAASEPVSKLLASAVANAEHNLRLDPDSLIVSVAYVDEGPTLKRFRPRAQGRAYRIRKRTSHITIELEAVAPKVVKAAKAAPARRGAAAKAAASAPDPARAAAPAKAAPAKAAPAKAAPAKAGATAAPAKAAAAPAEPVGETPPTTMTAVETGAPAPETATSAGDAGTAAESAAPAAGTATTIPASADAAGSEDSAGAAGAENTEEGTR